VADFSDVTNVQINSIVFQDFATAERFDLTTSWQANGCATTAWSNSTIGASAYQLAIDEELCIHGSSKSKLLFQNSVAFCAGMVTSVHYTISHSNNVNANITRVVADVVISDVPMTVQQVGMNGVTVVS
jgi:hypothetical protein